MHVTAILQLTLKAEVVFTCIFGFRLSQGSVATLIRWGGWSEAHIPSHVSFISKSNSENCIEIRWFLMKLQTKYVGWPTVYNISDSMRASIELRSDHFEVFAPSGTCCTDESEIWRSGVDSPCQIPSPVPGWGRYGAPKLKILCNFGT